MESGKIKIKANGRHQLKIGKKTVSIPKEFLFDEFAPNNYDCQIDKLDGKIQKIVINGKEVPKNDLEIQKKKEQAIKREKRKEAEKLKQQQERRKEPQQRHNNNRSYQNTNPRKEDSYSLNHAKVPSDVKKQLEHQDVSTANFYLKLFKFARFDFKDNKGVEMKFTFFNSSELKDRDKNVLVPKMEINSNDYGGIFKFDQITSNQINIATALYGNEGFVTKSFKPDWRFVVGLGIDSVYETGITLHHIYGFPYVPASAIKGICNHYAQDNGYHQSQSEFKSYYDTIFGGTDKKGKIIFLDAMPKTIPQLKTDIMNPHYPEWYGSGKPPTDTQSPRPIPFLTVEETEYQFILASKDRNRELLKTAMEWLENALKEKGIGAKTAVGYGYMSE
jgi:CRISPR-associated protein Cmr6